MGKFVMGRSGNPKGRPKGKMGGRMAALAALDRLVSRRQNVAALEDALQEAFTKNPLGFFRTYLMPLMPKESRLDVGTKMVVEWRTLATKPLTGEKPPVNWGGGGRE